MGMLDGLDIDNAELMDNGFAPIPNGFYKAIIESGEKKTSKKGTDYLALTFQIIDGEYKNRTVFHNLNLWHTNNKAVDIAKSDMKKICLSVNIKTPKDPCELFDLPLLIKIKQETRKGTEGEDKIVDNRISDFKPVGSVIQKASEDKPNFMA